MVNLLMRFSDVWSRAITIDGHDLRHVTQQSLRSQLGIAHRLSTIREADKVVMSLGKIEEVGTHDELMDRGGMYDNLYTMQWQGQGDLAADGCPGWGSAT